MDKQEEIDKFFEDDDSEEISKRFLDSQKIRLAKALELNKIEKDDDLGFGILNIKKFSANPLLFLDLKKAGLLKKSVLRRDYLIIIGKSLLNGSWFRKISRETGVDRRTISNFYKALEISLGKEFKCECGKRLGHKATCKGQKIYYLKKICENCSSEFLGHLPHTKYCSKKCYDKNRHRLYWKKYKEQLSVKRRGNYQKNREKYLEYAKEYYRNYRKKNLTKKQMTGIADAMLTERARKEGTE